MHRRNELRASKILQERAFKNKKISFIWDSEVKEILGNDKFVTDVKLKNLKTGKITEMKIDGIFLAVGHIPNSKVCEGINKDELGFIITNGVKTNVEGVFAAGDVQDKRFRQAVTAAGTGCMAAMEAERYLSR